MARKRTPRPPTKSSTPRGFAQQTGNLLLPYGGVPSNEPVGVDAVGISRTRGLRRPASAIRQGYGPGKAGNTASTGTPNAAGSAGNRTANRTGDTHADHATGIDTDTDTDTDIDTDAYFAGDWQDTGHAGAADGSEEFEEGPSKSQRKRDMTALQDLGERLSELPDAVLRSLDLPERLTDALIAARKLRSHEGRRRHFQFIGKLMRTVDPQPIIDLLARRERPHREDVDAMHAAELWRERLIADDAVFDDLLRTIPFDDVQSLRINIRAARAEVAAQRHGRQYRLLYKRIHEAIAPRRAPKTANDDKLDIDHPLPQRNDS